MQDLTAETAKLKSANNMESISVDKLVKLLNILELNIRDGSKVCPLATGEEDDSEEDSLFLEVCDMPPCEYGSGRRDSRNLLGMNLHRRDE